ncbi:DNA recombination protein RmuC [Immundisolibacter sp.]|uniref:DNA recombination protein RmuC n=1 Tax=Immundisolibacter sp. TaxID=1934948 RepID=UPI0035657C37
MEFTVVAMIALGVGLALVFGLIVVLQARARLVTALAASQQQAAGLAADVDGLRLERQALAEERARLQADALRLAPLEATLHERDAALRQRADEVQALAVRLERATTELAEERRRSEEKLAVLQEARGQLTEQFKNLSQEILEDKSRRFTEQNKTNLDALLIPLREQIGGFQKRVEDVYDKESRDRVSLLKEIHTLRDLNQTIAVDAVNLTNALKGQTRTQGVWGEMVLERVLEQSGLQKDREYEVQVSLSSDAGRQRPDVIVHLPDGKDVVIDAKVSLTAYERYASAQDDATRAQALREHVASLRAHIRGLGDKNYQLLQGVRSLDFVLLFVPIEPAYMEALRAEPALFTEALERNIGLVNPTTLLTTLRMIQNVWRYEHQSRNAQEIARRAGDLYDKFVGFVQDLDAVDNRLDSTRKAFDAARNKLVSGRGNLIKRAEDLKALGVEASKSLPAEMLDQAQAELQAPPPDGF